MLQVFESSATEIDSGEVPAPLGNGGKGENGEQTEREVGRLVCNPRSHTASKSDQVIKEMEISRLAMGTKLSELIFDYWLNILIKFDGLKN